MPAQTIPLDWALKVTVGAVRNGISLDELLAQCHIEPKYGDSRDRISHAQYVLLCMTAGLVIRDSLQGLGHKPMETGFTPMTVRVIDGCRTLEDAIDALGKFFRLAGPSLQVGLRTDNDEAALTIYADSPDDEWAYTLESNHTGWLSLCLSHFLGRRLPLTGITTRDPNHMSLNQAHWALGAPVSAGSLTAIRFPRVLLASRRAGSSGRNPYLDCVRGLLETSERVKLGEWRDQVDENGTPLQLNELARRAGVSASTMRRRFDQYEGGFRQARQRKIVDVAVGMLKTCDASVDSIAMDLGYADARSFRRFIKGATGKTPQELRSGEDPIDEDVPHEPIYQRIAEVAELMDA